MVRIEILTIRVDCLYCGEENAIHHKILNNREKITCTCKTCSRPFNLKILIQSGEG